MILTVYVAILKLDLNILQHFLFFVSRKKETHRFLKRLKSALLSRPELQPLQHHLFRYTKYRWWPAPRNISKCLWVGHHLPHVCVHLLSHLGVYLCWEVGRSLKVSMPPQWWIQEKTNVFHTTVHSPESQGEKYPSFKQHDPGKLNMMWKRPDLLRYFAMFSYSGLLHLRHENRNGPFAFLGQCVRHFTSYWKGHFMNVIFTEKTNGLEDALPMMQYRDTALCEPGNPRVAINLVHHMPRGIP